VNPNRIIATGPILPVAEEILGRFGTIEIAAQTDETSLMSMMDRTVALIVRGLVPITAALIESATGLRVIGRTGSGFENVDIQAATRRGIPVVFAPAVGSKPVAEATLAMLLALAKQLPDLDRKTRGGDWTARSRAVIRDLDGALLGIIGLGRIGREVARLAQAFGMQVMACDPAVSAEAGRALKVEMTTLDYLLENSDFISVHAPLTSETRGMINRERLSRLKPGAIFVNMARGGLVESLDVIHEALESGRLAGAGLDVFPVQPPDTSHPIFRHPRLLCSPHTIGLSQKAAQGIFTLMSQGMADVLEGRAPENVVNPEVFKHGTAATMS
jgi:D-3-phosphoglycerate dehydrogenase